MAQRDMNTLIKCENCGEYYSATYKECPFCDDFEDDYYQDDYQETPRRRSTHGGRRLVTNKRGGGYGRGWDLGRILITVASIGMIVAAIWIVFTVVKPLVDRGQVDPSNSPNPPITSQSPAPSESPNVTDAPPVSSEDPQPEPSGGDIPADQTATGFTLSHTDFSFSKQYPAPITIKVTFFPAGSTGTITWTSSDPDVAAVDANGKVTHGTKAGTTTITATMAGGAKQTCTVRSTIEGGTSTPSPSPSPSPSTNPNANLSLNKTDFTFSSLNEPAVQMKVNGTSSTPTWSIGNTSVATISSDGKVRPVGNGTTNITCTVDGQTLKCIVRVKLR